MLVRRDLVTDFLKSKRKRLLFCFRSHRFSERSPDELKLKEKYETFRADRWHYVQEYRDIGGGQNSDRFSRDRMETFSFLFGKSAIPTLALTSQNV